MWETIILTAKYTNAVLTAVLPYVSEFSEKLNLPIQTPVNTRAVVEVVCGNKVGDVEAYLRLTNDFEFRFRHGHFELFSRPSSLRRINNPVHFTNFVGPLKISRDTAISVARNAMVALNYHLRNDVFGDLPPVVTVPRSGEHDSLSRYYVEWSRPDGSPSVQVEVDSISGSVESIYASSPNLWRPPPALGLEPEILSSPFLTISPTEAKVQREWATRLISRLCNDLPLNATDLSLISGAKVSSFRVPEVRVNFELADGSVIECQKNGNFYFSSSNSLFLRLNKPINRNAIIGPQTRSAVQIIDYASKCLKSIGIVTQELETEPTCKIAARLGTEPIARALVMWDTENFNISLDINTFNLSIVAINIKGVLPRATRERYLKYFKE